MNSPPSSVCNTISQKIPVPSTTCTFATSYGPTVSNVFAQNPLLPGSLHSCLYKRYKMPMADMTLKHQANPNMLLFDLVSRSPNRKIRFSSVRLRQRAPAQFETYFHDKLIQGSLTSTRHVQTDSGNISTTTATKYTSNSSWTAFYPKMKALH
jgi:hypothetical protein